MMLDNEESWAPLADLYRLAREVTESRDTLMAQYDDLTLAVDERMVFEAEVLDQFALRFDGEYDFLMQAIAQGRRWQAEEVLSAYKQAVLTKLLNDAADGIEQIFELFALLPELPTTPGSKHHKRAAQWTAHEGDDE